MMVYRNQFGQLHRVDGPALVYANGTQLWYLNDQLHRVDGPAVEYPDGMCSWLINGQLHRLDGPAIIRADGSQEWWVNGQRLTGFEVWVLTGTKEGA